MQGSDTLQNTEIGPQAVLFNINMAFLTRYSKEI